jgi:hypothetical protein
MHAAVNVNTLAQHTVLCKQSLFAHLAMLPDSCSFANKGFGANVSGGVNGDIGGLIYAHAIPSRAFQEKFA